MKLIAYKFSFLGLIAILVGVGCLAYCYFYETSSMPIGESNEPFRFFACMFGGIIAVAVGIYFLGLQKRKTP
jgi:hypothetical protein